MNQGVQLIKTASRALNTLDFERRCNVSSPRLDRLRERNRLVASRELRRAVAATITEIDTALMQDLMRIVKRLGRGGTNGDNGRKDPADVAVRIMEMAVGKRAVPHVTHLTWLFNTIYRNIAWAFQQSNQQMNYNNEGGIR